LVVVTKGIISRIKSRIALANCKQEEKDTTACDSKIIKVKTLIVARDENGAEAVYKNDSQKLNHIRIHQVEIKVRSKKNGEGKRS
jgi:hypothetical protein